MNVSIAEVIQIARNVTGRVDVSDPQFTNEEMLKRLQQFAELQATQDIRIVKNNTWYEFTLGPTDLNPYPVDLQNIVLVDGTVGASTIGPLCYADGFYVFWYQDPGDFYRLWPETQQYTPSRPTYVLYYNNELTFRNPPNKVYNIKIQAYRVEVLSSPNLESAYLYRYLAYGMALDIFSDYGEMDRWNEIYPVFRRYRALVYSRTYSQLQNQRPNPEF